MRKKSFVLTFMLVLFFSCQEKKEIVDSGVKVIRGDEFDKIATIKVIGGLDRGEYKLGDDPENIEITVKNNSSGSLVDLNLEIDFTSNGAMKFATDGLSQPASPGVGGTCGDILLSQKTCSYIITYNPVVQDEIYQNIIITYKNKLQPKIEKFGITMLTGEEGLLEFVEGSVYDNGLKERTDQASITETLTLKNVGFLPARDVDVSILNTHAGNSPAFEILSHDCPSILRNNETCQLSVKYESLNYKYVKKNDLGIPIIYGASAPDADSDMDYIGDLKVNYNGFYKDPNKDVFAYFSTQSVTIAASIAVSGLKDIEFVDNDGNSISAGNTLEKLVPITNSGYKEGIIKSINIRDNSGAIIANCVNAGGAYLECISSSDPGKKTSLFNNLIENPFEIEDVNNCFAASSDLDYTRLADKTLSIAGITSIGGSDGASGGETCFLKIVFHPSVNNITSGDYNNYEFDLIYDSTWKNEIFIHGAEASEDYLVRTLAAEFSSPAYLEIDGPTFSDKIMSLGDKEFGIIGTDQNCDMDLSVNSCAAPLGGAPLDLVSLAQDQLEVERFRCFDMGRVALSNSADFKRAAKIGFKNVGHTDAVSLEFSDGSANPIYSSPVNLNAFYESLSENCPSFIRNDKTGDGGFCDISYNFTPVHQNSTPDVDDALMFDEISAVPNSPHKYKVFTVSYDDGASINDDGTPRLKRTLHLKIRANLVQKGLLVFEEFPQPRASVVSGGQSYSKTVIKNLGVAPIKSIRVDPSKNGTRSRSGVNEIDIVPSAYTTGTEIDCYSKIEGFGGTQDTAIILNPGDECFLMQKLELNPNLKEDATNWGGLYTESLNNQVALYSDSTLGAGTNSDLKLFYFDGDISGRCADNSPQDTTYGDEITIAGTNSTSGEEGVSSLRFSFEQKAVFTPEVLTPRISSYLYLKSFDFPGVGVIPPETIPALYAVDAGYTEGGESSYSTDDEDFDLNIGNKNGIGRISDDNQAYSFFVGSFPSDGDTYTGSFTVANSSFYTPQDITLTPISGDPEITGSYNGGELSFSFLSSASNPSDRLYSRVFEFEYDNGEEIFPAITDYENNLVGTGVIKKSSFRVKVVFKAIKNAGDIRYDVLGYELNDTNGSPSQTMIPIVINENTVQGVTSTLTFTSVKGSSTIARKRVIIQNIGGGAIKDLRVYDVDKPFILEPIIADAPQGIFLFDTDCHLDLDVENLNTIDPAGGAIDSCYLDIGFKPLSAGSVTSGSIVVTYDIGNGEYVEKEHLYTANSTDPAKLIALDSGGIDELPTSTYATGEFVGVDPVYVVGHEIDLGEISMGSGTSWNGTYTFAIRNTSSIKASLRASLAGSSLNDLKTAVISSGWNELRLTPGPSGFGLNPVSKAGLKVEAHDECFDGLDTVGDPDELGFLGDICSIRVTLEITKDYLLPKLSDPSRVHPSGEGYEIRTDDLNFSIDYFSYKRESIAKQDQGLNFGFKGQFIPKKSTASNVGITNVVALSDGSLDFDWGPYNDATDPVWGDIVRYRVFFDQIEKADGKVYDICGPSNCLETTSVNDKSFSLVGLEIGKTYHIYISPIREFNGVDYVSDSPGMKFKILIPPLNSFYVYEDDILIDKYLTSENLASFTQSKAICAGQGKELITDNILQNYILNDLGSSTNYVFNAVHPHWLDEPAIDIRTLHTNMNLGYACNIENAWMETSEMYYAKSCNSCACDMLNKLYGRFAGLFPDVEYFSFPENEVGVTRCFTSSAADKF